MTMKSASHPLPNMVSNNSFGPVIRTWNVSFYDNSAHQWNYGLLNVSPEGLLFKSNDLDGKGIAHGMDVLQMSFTHILRIDKAMSSIIFPAITVTTKNKELYWFSSLSDRNEVFLMLQHFHQASLFLSNKTSENEKTVSTNADLFQKQQKTRLGSELLQSVTDSHRTLSKAAESLSEQGCQLSSLAYTVEEMHEDLSVASRIVGGLDSWLGRWKIPKAYKESETIFIKDNDIPDVLDVEALCTQITATKFGSQTECVFRLAAGGITILSMRQKVIHSFKWSDVSRIRVISPWEILVTKYLIGQPDLSFGIIAVAMPNLLHQLKRFAANKMEFMKMNDNHEKVTHPDPAFNSSSSFKGLTVSNMLSSAPDLEHSQLTAQDRLQKEAITDDELAELNSTLSNVKHLALNIQKEEDSQLGAIDRLTESVSRADHKVKELNSTIKRLT